MPRKKGPTPILKENSLIQSRMEKSENKSTAETLLKKCKAHDKGKKEYPVIGSPVKTWFISSSLERAKKRIEEFKKSLIVKS